MTDQTQHMLLQIRQLLNQADSRPPLLPFSNKDAEKMLKVAGEFAKKQKEKDVKQMTREKLKQAAEILHQKECSPAIVNYTREKIGSEMFAAMRPEVTAFELQHIDRKRQQLLKARAEEQKQMEDHEEWVIENTKKFIKCQSSSLPYSQINSLIFQEGQTSLLHQLKQKEELRLSSQDNRILNSSMSIAEKFKEKEKQIGKNVRSHILRSLSYIQVEDRNSQEEKQIEVQDEEKFDYSSLKAEREERIQRFLNTHENIVRLFGHILSKQYQLYQSENKGRIPDPNRVSLRKSLIKTDSRVSFIPGPKRYTRQEWKGQSAESLFKTYQFKKIALLPKNSTPRHGLSGVISTRLIRKMIGSTSDFHTKRAVLTENELNYYDEEDLKESNGKKIDLVIQKIEIRKAKKEEGSFFSKSQLDVEVIVLRGSNRNLTFELNLLEGREMYQDLSRFMALKMYNLTVIIGCNCNAHLFTYITDAKATTFDLSRQFLQPHERYPLKEYRSLTLQMLVGLAKERQGVSWLNLLECKLNTAETLLVIRELRHWKDLNRITITQTKMTVQVLTKLLEVIKGLKGVRLTIAQCSIEDATLLACEGQLVQAAGNIVKLDISDNLLTSKSLVTLGAVFKSAECSIESLRINGCPIMSLIGLGELIKKSGSLISVSAERCGLAFSDKTEVQRFFQLCQGSRLSKLSLLRNQALGDLFLIDKCWATESPREINVEIGVFSEKTSRNLQGRLIQ